MCCEISLEPSRRDGANEWSQHMFPRNNENKQISYNYSYNPSLSGFLVYVNFEGRQCVMQEWLFRSL